MDFLLQKLKPIRKKTSALLRAAGVFLVAGAFLFLFSIFFEVQVAAFIGLGLVFWGAIFAATQTNRYVETSLLDSTAKSSYATMERVMNDLKFAGHAYYLPAYPQDVTIPEYLKPLREPVVFIAEDFDGKPSVDELAQGKFISDKTQGIFIASPGAGLMAHLEKQLQMDFSKATMDELISILPRSLTDGLSLARSVNMTVTPGGVDFKGSGIVYESLYRPEAPLKSVSILGCPVVSAVASALAKNSGRTVTIKDQVLSRGGTKVRFEFLGETA